MHTIQAQFSLNDFTGAIVMNSNSRRDTVTDEFILVSSAITDSTAITVDYGDIVIPYRVCFKHVSGEPVGISFDNLVTFPMILQSPGDFIVIQINEINVPIIKAAVYGSAANVIYTVEPK